MDCAAWDSANARAAHRTELATGVVWLSGFTHGVAHVRRTRRRDGFDELEPDVAADAFEQSLSATERDKRKKDAENELLGLRDLETRIKQFDNTSRTTLGEKQRRMRDNILQEIKDTIKARVKTGAYTLVLDTASETPNGTPIILFSAGNDDLTDSVLAQLNVNAPAATPAARPGTPP